MIAGIDPSDECHPFPKEILELNDIDIHDAEAVFRAIDILEKLSRVFAGELLENTNVIIGEQEVEFMLQVYDKSISILKQNEGVDFNVARDALAVALGLIQFMLGFLYARWGWLDIELPNGH